MLLRGLIKAYQLMVSPFTPPHCRYWPTCSEYALEAVRVHGAMRGGWYALRRIGRCHPWGGHGYDPVPDAPDTDDRRWPSESERKLAKGE